MTFNRRGVKTARGTGQWVMAAGASTPRRGEPRRVLVQDADSNYIFFLDILFDIFLAGATVE
jgi:hypothetical protein